MYEKSETWRKIIPVGARGIFSSCHSDILIYYYIKGLQIYHNLKKLSSLLQPDHSHETGQFTYSTNKTQSPSKLFQARFHQMLISHGSHAFTEKIILNECCPTSSKHCSLLLHSTYFWTLLTLSFVKQPALSFLLCCLACFLSFYKWQAFFFTKKLVYFCHYTRPQSQYTITKGKPLTLFQNHGFNEFQNQPAIRKEL